MFIVYGDILAEIFGYNDYSPEGRELEKTDKNTHGNKKREENRIESSLNSLVSLVHFDEKWRLTFS
jgi:hypothetical protein